MILHGNQFVAFNTEFTVLIPVFMSVWVFLPDQLLDVTKDWRF